MSRFDLSKEELLPLITETLSSGKKISLTVTGNSMFPLFAHKRDTVYLEKAVVYKPKDIVLYLRDENTPVLHRIMRKKDKGFAICGDNQNVMEYPVPEENVLGRVYEFERKGKRITTDNFLYRIYSTIWCLGLKHRRVILHFPLKMLAKKIEKRRLK